MICSSCGHAVAGELHFCTSCGAELGAKETQAKLESVQPVQESDRPLAKIVPIITLVMLIAYATWYLWHNLPSDELLTLHFRL